MKIVAFNGPPQSGKDTLADLLQSRLWNQSAVRNTYLSTPLRGIAFSMTNYGWCEPGPEYEKFKVTHFPAFNRTGRQLMIDISESFLKPMYGNDIMPKLLKQRLLGFNGVVLLRDTGFEIELASLSTWVRPEDIYLVKVQRSGKDFSNDSREWLEHSQQMTVVNDSSLEDLKTEAGRIYGRMVNQLGWKL